eukprot:CAMPEP_0174238060 /NCGR_PEP_ID=MMETSP0417-20130205/10178_1 /TAXON_ID=242541 /ORGANISM="Mayorella sp, Strain BSH-02190019" /LENGTH=279 /DNA_ID=CAMNT_0015316865 /DNA_START=60 /DNA_END=896 /DNA_ORIENTATION=+
MEWLFGKKKTPQEIIREHQRVLNRAVRDLDRERNGLLRQERRTQMEIKKMARAGQMDAARMMALDIVRTRKQAQQMFKMRTQLKAVSLRLQTIKSQAAMTEAMAGVTKAMVRMNKSMNLPAMQRVMMEFERQSEMLDMKEEIMNDALDDTFDASDEDEDTEEIVNKVLDEIGIDFEDKLVDAPMASVGARVAEQPTRTQVGEDGAGSAAFKPRAADPSPPGAQPPTSSGTPPSHVDEGADRLSSSSSSSSSSAAGAGAGTGPSDADADLFARFSALGKP